jgi:hypothetical protein
MLGRYEKAEQTALKGLLKNLISNLKKNPFFLSRSKVFITNTNIISYCTSTK